MGQQPRPDEQELEFVYKAIARGLSNLEIMDELGDTEFPRRTDARYFRQRRREYNAARKVLDERIAAEQDPLLIEKRRKHEEELVSALSALRYKRLWRMNALYRWGDTGPESVSMEHRHHDLEVPEHPHVARLLQHLDSDDEILVAYRETVEIFKEGVGLSTQLACKWVTQMQTTGLTLRPDSMQTVPGIYSQFLSTLTDVALERGWSGREDVEYERVPVSSPPAQYSKLRFHGGIIAVGSPEQVDTAQATHRALICNLEHGEPGTLIMRLRDARDRYIKLAHEVNRLIDIRSRQRMSKEGTCEVCAAWGGG